MRRLSKRLSSPMMRPVTLVMPADLTAWASWSVRPEDPPQALLEKVPVENDGSPPPTSHRLPCRVPLESDPPVITWVLRRVFVPYR